MAERHHQLLLLRAGAHAWTARSLFAAYRAAQSSVRLLERLITRLQGKPRTESAVKGAGAVVAALLALKYAQSLRAALLLGLLAGVFTHSLYADVINRKPPTLLLESRRRRRWLSQESTGETDIISTTTQTSESP
ncbi:hypothetical protein P43SY_000938 [Pythium insidiosum]|uniref:Uncharacterized protein n=1 Tax=Pythium insidiosum TaxID=114742 RepID=A0AAD5LWA4_PYTIN|nr:hypothetical protein P43SY_000938 [Pythium insidiosum]